MDRELAALWRGLFSTQDGNFSAASSDPQHPPSLVLEALDFLYPFQESFHDLQACRQSTLLYSGESGLSRDGVLKALTWPFSSKLVVVYGTAATDVASREEGSRQTRSSTRNAEASQPAILAIMTSSPLWCVYKTGAIDDFLVGDAHLLLELAPRPRVLWYADAQTKYADLVDTTDDASIFFRRSATGTAGGGSARTPSGLDIDLNDGVATLRSSPRQTKEREQGYVEVSVGRRGEPTTKVVDKPAAWESTVRIQKVEVYSGSGGVLQCLSVRRSS